MLKRIILHWTAGADGVNQKEADSYNFIVARTGVVTNGSHPPEAQTAANVKKGSKFYAAHCLNCNTGSIGVSLDAMADAKESPFDAGKYPITEIQLDAMAELCVALMVKYKIPLTKETVLTHAEVQPTLGIRQNQKWDIRWLPGMAGVGGAIEVGDKLRAMIAAKMNATALAPAIPVLLPVLRKGSRDAEHVSNAQRALIRAKYLSGKGGERADGVFGNLTFFAVKAFQRDKGLKDDGVIGAKTWAELQKE